MIYNDLALFTAVAKQLSFSAAARQTDIPLSRVSRRIAELENHLGVKLFERSTRQVRLTEEGRRLLDRCQEPMEKLQEVAGFNEDARHQVIRITAPSLAARTTIGPRMLDYTISHPEVSIHLTTSNSMLDFFRDNIDFAFRLGPLNDSSLIAQKLWDVAYCFCASKTFIEKHQLSGAIKKSQLVQLPAIVSRQPWQLEKAETLSPQNILHELDDLELIQQAVKRDLGIAMLPVDLLDSQMQQITLDDGKVLSRVMYAVYPGKRLLPQRVRDLIEFMRQPDNQKK